MGAWGYGVFENDEAEDWVGELVEVDDLDMVFDTLDDVDRSGAYLEMDESCAALCAAEVVAALAGNASPDLPDDLAEWLEDKEGVDRETRVLARSVVEQVYNDSELRELWEESKSFRDWKDTLRDLRLRLR